MFWQTGPKVQTTFGSAKARVSIFILSSVLFHGGAAFAGDKAAVSSPFRYVGKVDGCPIPGSPFSPDGKQLAVGFKDGVIIYDLQSLKPVTHILRQEDAAYASFVNDGTQLFTAGGTTACFWDVRTSTLMSSIEVFKGDRISLAAISTDGKHFVTDAPDIEQALLWDAERHTRLIAVLHHTRGIKSMEIVRDGKCVFTCQDAGPREPLVHLWDVETGNEMFSPAIMGQPGLFAQDRRRRCPILMARASWSRSEEDSRYSSFKPVADWLMERFSR